MVGKSTEFSPNPIQSAYLKFIKAGKYVSDTTLINSKEDLINYYISKVQEREGIPQNE